jgi:hypothetical protein
LVENTMNRYLPALALCLAVFAGAAWGHGPARPADEPDEARYIQFPDTAEHLTLVADLHTHSVFSDGHVWPRTRIEEALRDGLDAIAITEHLEWQPHLGDIPHDDRNRAFEIAADAARETDLLVIAGTEITRRMPVGHINAIFITDANDFVLPILPEGAAEYAELEQTDSRGEQKDLANLYYDYARNWPAENAIDRAYEQGAFLFWNHPDWPSQVDDGITRPTAVHERLIADGKLHGIEVANGRSWSEESFRLALEKNLTMLGVSDIHELIDWDYEPHKGGHRPVTLIFAEERTAESLREALFAGRTAVWYRNLLLGREEHLRPLLEASLVVDKVAFARWNRTVELTLSNRSDADFILENRMPHSVTEAGYPIEIPAHSTKTIVVRTGADAKVLDLRFAVQNALVAPRTPLEVSYRLPIEVPAE